MEPNQIVIEESPKPDKKWKKRAKISLIVITVIAVLAGGGYLYYMYKESMAYKSLAESTNIKDYETYLDNFPYGKHYEEVKEDYLDLKAEYSDWRDYTDNGTSDSPGTYESYLQEHPYSHFATEAKLKIDSLIWDEALRLGTAESYRDYCYKVKDGKHYEEAQQLAEKLERNILSDSEREMAQSAIYTFFSAIDAKDAQQLLSCVDNTIVLFGHKANKNNVLNYMLRLYAEDVYDINISTSIDNVSKSIAENNAVKYIVNFSTDMQFSREDTSKETYRNSTGSAVVNEEGKIVSLTSSKAAGY